MVFKRLEDKLGLPPLQDVTTLLTGPTGKRIDSLISRLEKLSQDKSVLVQTLELLKLIQQMDETGTLDKLNKLLGNIPKGKSGEAMITELHKVITELVPRLDKLSALASALLGKE